MEKTTVAAYYFPNYHIDPHNELSHGPGWTEWELVKRAEPRFPGHQQPRVPLWGYEDEADPDIMAKKIAAAADHAIDVFLFDWYYYNDGPFLERALEKGFLHARNNHRLKFAIHWANHTWINIHPAKLSASPYQDAIVEYPGAVSGATFDRLTDHVVNTYFLHPSYWLIDGCPYFSVYDLNQLVAGLGGVAAAARALAQFREKTRAAGFPDAHLNAVVWNQAILPGEKALAGLPQLVAALGFDSFTSYVWIHHDVLRTFPATDYNEACDRYVAYWDQVESEYTIPYFPNVTMGWDPSPRTVQSDAYLDRGYPFTATLQGNTPAAFKDALTRTKARMDVRDTEHRILSLNAWNEWTESSYLEPDTRYGMGYLEAVREVFGV